jgi:hypothetical protein
MTDRRCPRCGQPYLTRTRPRIEQDVAVRSLYRHRYGGRTYLHRMRFSSSRFHAVDPIDLGDLGVADD